MARLTDAQIVTAKAWLHDIFVLAKEIPACRGDGYGYMYGASWRRDSLTKYALDIVNELKMREFKDLDKAFDFFSNEYFGSDMSDSWSSIKKKADMLAKYVAWFCYSNKIYWNDTIYGPEELDVFKATYLGKALSEYDCFATTPDRKATTGLGGSRSARVSSVDGGARTSASSGSGYKSMGPMSSKARDLKGEPGKKEVLRGKLYTVEGDSTTTKSIPAAFIKPLDAPGAKGSTNQVFFGTSWKGYKNCVCYYTTEDEAKAVAEKLKADSKVPGTVSRLNISYRFADANGYFKVGTEYGDCYILARELNEELEEGLTEVVEMSEAAKAYMAIPLEEECYEMTDLITNPDEYFKNYRRSED